MLFQFIVWPSDSNRQNCSLGTAILYGFMKRPSGRNAATQDTTREPPLPYDSSLSFPTLLLLYSYLLNLFIHTDTGTGPNMPPTQPTLPSSTVALLPYLAKALTSPARTFSTASPVPATATTMSPSPRAPAGVASKAGPLQTKPSTSGP